MATICQCGHYLCCGSVSETGSRESKRGQWWFWVIFMILSPSPHPLLYPWADWLIMEQNFGLIIYVCHMSRPPPYLHPHVNHLRHSNWSTRMLWPSALPHQSQLQIQCLSRESEDKTESASLRSLLSAPRSLTSFCLAWLPSLRMFTLNWAAHSSPGPQGTPLCHFQWLT